MGILQMSAPRNIPLNIHAAMCCLVCDFSLRGFSSSKGQHIFFVRLTLIKSQTQSLEKHLSKHVYVIFILIFELQLRTRCFFKVSVRKFKEYCFLLVRQQL